MSVLNRGIVFQHISILTGKRRAVKVTWRREAACRDYLPTDADTDIWFGTSTIHMHPEARKLCRSCPVSSECLIDAISEEAAGDISLSWGVRGGMTAQARKRLRRVIRNAKAPTKP